MIQGPVLDVKRPPLTLPRAAVRSVNCAGAGWFGQGEQDSAVAVVVNLKATWTTLCKIVHIRGYLSDN